MKIIFSTLDVSALNSIIPRLEELEVRRRRNKKIIFCDPRQINFLIFFVLLCCSSSLKNIHELVILCRKFLNAQWFVWQKRSSVLMLKGFSLVSFRRRKCLTQVTSWGGLSVDSFYYFHLKIFLRLAGMRDFHKYCKQSNLLWILFDMS